MTPSVTEIIKPWVSFSGIPKAVLDAAAERGTAVHDACFSIARSQYPGPLADNVQGYVTSFERWFDSQVQDVILIEERLHHPAYFYHGEPDLIILLKTGARALIDIKTPLMAAKSWHIQVAGYRELAKANKMAVKAAGTIQPDPDGKIPKVIWSKDTSADLAVFLQMLNIHRYMKGA
jgi:hypothetical protein